MSTWIKICGLTNLEDALLALRLGADALGFVFHPASKRFCPPATARSMIRELPSHLLSVGVWFEEPADEIAEAARIVGCKCIQTYNPSVARSLRDRGFHVIPAIPTANGMTIDDAWRACCASSDGRVIIDFSRPPRGSATDDDSKKISEWNDMVSSLSSRAQPVLAGGLRPENVFAKLETFRPAGVDVASGLELIAGRKDPAKMRRFIEEVRRWDATAGSMNLADSLFQKP